MQVLKNYFISFTLPNQRRRGAPFVWVDLNYGDICSFNATIDQRRRPRTTETGLKPFLNPSSPRHCSRAASWYAPVVWTSVCLSVCAGCVQIVYLLSVSAFVWYNSEMYDKVIAHVRGCLWMLKCVWAHWIWHTVSHPPRLISPSVRVCVRV